MSAQTWKLYYWPVGGRGEFIRLLFEDAGQKFTEINDPAKIKEICMMAGPNEQEGWPAFAPPVLEKAGGPRLAQTPAICKYLGKQLGYIPQPDTPVNDAKLNQVNLTVHDCWTELYKAAKSEDISAFEGRFKAFTSYFEKALKANGGGSGLFLVGQKPTYADFALLQVLRFAEDLMPEAFSNLEGHELLKGFKKRMESRPNLAAYFKSDRVLPSMLKPSSYSS